jgi:hypothetical protein
VLLASVTITNNTADSDAASDGYWYGDGGGIAKSASTIARVKNTIIAGNFDRSPIPVSERHPDLQVEQGTSGAFVSEGNNLIGIGEPNSGFTNGIAQDQVGTPVTRINPRLGTLARNGGRTLTHAIQTDSPAIDAGNAGGCRDADGSILLMTDQRSVSRALDGNGDSLPVCDIGAFEYQRP